LRPTALALAGLAFAGVLSTAAAQTAPTAPRAFSDAEMRAAAYLAANCANCHGTAGRSPGAMPSLAGIPRAYLVRQMQDFRDGRRTATLMHQIAKGYTDEQYEAMAEYFSRQKPR
jgi:cytochrome c553